jgi:5-methylcytosine-specific restriction endonuclease McrA
MRFPGLCVECGASVNKSPHRGPMPKRCDACSRNHRNALARRRRTKPHRCKCRRCDALFPSARKQQKYCSPECAHLASRDRVPVCCAECGKQFEHAKKKGESRKFCSWDCWQKSHAVPKCKCHNCGNDFPRKSYTHPWQGKNKFCSRECAWDHRWGADRPRRPRSANDRNAWSRRSRITTLKHRCRHYGCPFDPSCTREAVCERDGWVCQKCGVQCHKGEHRMIAGTRRCDPRSAEHDHIWPLSLPGGPGNVMSNSQCLCRKCNGRKRNKGGSQLRLAYVG